MAAAGDLLDQDQFSCSICLDLLKDPVTIPCGHSYCMDCIKGCWDQGDQTGVYSCPQCRQTFAPRPILGRNTMLAEVVEKLKTTELQAAPPAHCYAGPGDVACDVCTGRKRKATKSCLECLASYCEMDLMLHEKLNRGKAMLMETAGHPAKRHKLIEATAQLEEKICSRHCMPLEVYCRSDQQCICLLCVMDEHRGHDTVSAAAEMTVKQSQLGETQRKSQQRIQEREKELQDLRQAVKSLTRSAQAAVEDSERIFTELIRSIERRRSEVKELIRDQEKAAVSWSIGLLERLEQEIAELKRRDAEMEQLLQAEDHIHFLQNFHFFSSSSGHGDLPSITVNPDVSFGFAKKSVSELKERLEDVCKEELAKFYGTGVYNVSVPEPRTRAEFLKYACQLTLDPNTAHRHLCVSEGDGVVKHVGEEQPYPDHPDRFENFCQVLCREGLSGRYYWETRWSGQQRMIATSYKTVGRKERCAAGGFGFNQNSWNLYFCASKYSCYHNGEKTDIPTPTSARIGVYLDHSAGILSFYSVSDTMTLLHRVRTTFTQPLYPGFWLGPQSSAKLGFLR
ncbi:tripartite motif-containing protein 16-like isoform X3 [Megalops cyprinoides]|uniref:tripartite motif-containing protein 16-like isoform X3 n=1 Tax=Megalops cyprinoides TaxID=118141 RepID=UPI0018648ACD|nr:tripartite motif-containing protein 16-like isoform X3 [Megalops cyprinoides]